MNPITWLDPVTRKRLKRFREMKRAWWAFWILILLYAASLGSELLCNDKPLMVRFNGATYFPLFRFYPEDTFLGNGRMTRPDYKTLAESPIFKDQPGNTMIFPLIPHGPLESIKPDRIEIPNQVEATWVPEPRVGTVDAGPDGVLRRPVALEWLEEGGTVLDGRTLEALAPVSAALRAAMDRRFANQDSPAYEESVVLSQDRRLVLSLSAFRPRSAPPRTVRLTLRKAQDEKARRATVRFSEKVEVVSDPANIWTSLNEADREQVRARVRERFAGTAAALAMTVGGQPSRVEFSREVIRYPFRPVHGHPLGLDSAGRDVLARLLYGLRISLTFGVLLVLAAMVMGTLIGALQGYYSGRVDLIGQRVIEIWESLPFLYVMILLGSIYGQGFLLLLVVYGLFNWIGISYYMRAEFLRLRKLPFVEAAHCMGLPGRKIIFRHILPNALVPLVTFFPFSLVGAIGSLAALDYLGFGLPPPTPSWGDLLSQAQEYSWAWWLVLYPTLALFVVMLLGVFIGEGVQSAFNPRKFSRLE